MHAHQPGMMWSSHIWQELAEVLGVLAIQYHCPQIVAFSTVLAGCAVSEDILAPNNRRTLTDVAQN